LDYFQPRRIIENLSAIHYCGGDLKCFLNDPSVFSLDILAIFKGEVIADDRVDSKHIIPSFR